MCLFIVFIDLTMRQETLKAVIDCLADWEVAGGMVMVNRCVALACKSFVSVAVMLVLVGAVLAQARIKDGPSGDRFAIKGASL